MSLRRRKKTAREPTIALINIVFLMLIFFLIAGTLAPPLEPGVTLVRVAGLEPAPPPDALVIHADGHLTHAGRPATLAAFAATGAALGILPDRDLPARELIRIAVELRALGAQSVRVVTAREIAP